MELAQHGIAAIPDGYAVVNVFYDGKNVDLPDPMPVGLDAARVLQACGEALGAAFSSTDFVVDVRAQDAVYPFARYIVRPSVSFGAMQAPE